MLKRFWLCPLGKPRPLGAQLLGHWREGCCIDARLYQLELGDRVCLLRVRTLMVFGFYVMLLWFHRGFWIAVMVYVFQDNEKDLHDLLG
jgi:hypothetical protein